MLRLFLFVLAFLSLSSRVCAQIDSYSAAYYCREEVGEEPWRCDDRLCGGEHRRKKGYCARPIYRTGKENGQWVMTAPRYCKCGESKGDGGSKVPPIIPFPPPPPGFSLPPPGVPNPNDQNSCPEDFTDTRCKDCKGKSGWCTDGLRAGCPCRDECPADDSGDVPRCKDEICRGEDGKCTTGPQADCKCNDTCPDPDKNEVVLCNKEECKSDDDETCKEGKYRGCKCAFFATPGPLQERDVDQMKQGLDMLKNLKDIYDNPDKYKPKPDTKCSGTYSDALPISRDQAYKMADQYCDKLDKRSKDTSKDLKWDQYTFHFNYKAGDKCWSDCKETVHDMICSGYDSHSIKPEAKATFKCGDEYSLKITDGTKDSSGPDPKHTCVGPDDISQVPGGKVDSELQKTWGAEFCKSTAGKKIKAGDKTIEKDNVDNTREMNAYSYSVSWKEDCKSEVTELDVQYPLGKDDKNTCESLMQSTYEGCDKDGGVGGYYDVGCVRYSFVILQATKQ